MQPCVKYATIEWTIRKKTILIASLAAKALSDVEEGLVMFCLVCYIVQCLSFGFLRYLGEDDISFCCFFKIIPLISFVQEKFLST